MGDPGRLGQVLIYLVGNAVKFTETGYIRLRAMDGISLRHDVRRQGEFGELRLVLFASMGEKGEVGEIQQVGFDAYLNKPVLSETLRDVLSAVLMRQPGDRW